MLLDVPVRLSVLYHCLIPKVRLGGLQSHANAIKRCRRIIVIASGTSYNRYYIILIYHFNLTNFVFLRLNVNSEAREEKNP